MKYGYNDDAWRMEMALEGDKFTGLIWTFGVNGYAPMMKRKTVKEKDLKALEGLKEMVANLEKAMAEKRVVG